jgi:hypothetical protein
MKTAFAALALVLASAAPAFADTSARADSAPVAAAVSAAAAPAAASGERLICRRQEVSGTRVGAGERTCKTKAQWRAIEKAEKKAR